MTVPPIVSIVGKSGSGKTTLIEKLLKELLAKGYRVATIKHDAHSFDVDHAGKDSWRHREAGAAAVVIASSSRLFLTRNLDVEWTAEQIRDQYLAGDYDMEWAQTPLIILMICTPPLSIVALLPADGRRASRQRRIERIAGAVAQHHNVTVSSGLSAEVERLASDPKQRKAAILLQSRQARISRAEAKADIEAFISSTER